MDKLHILLVEDLHEFAQKLTLELEDAGYAVSVIDTGEGAIDVCNKACPDLILMDVQLNGEMNGIQSIEIIKKSHDVPSIILTANMNDKVMHEAIASQADMYLPKTATFKEINASIMMAVKKHRDKIKQDEIIKDKLSRSVILAETNMRMILVMETLDKIRKEENRLYESNNITAFFHRVIEELMRLTEAQYGALAIFNITGKIEEFITLGMTSEQSDAIGARPTGRGFLEKVYYSNSVIRVDDIAMNKEQSVLPINHPPIRSLLGSAIIVNGKRRAAIYLANKKHQMMNYTDSDELVLYMLIPEIQHTLERNDLVNMLNIERATLKEQRDSQQKLINKISKMRDQLVQSEKMASIGQLAAGVAHEINNPIGYVSSNFSSLNRYIGDIFNILDLYETNEEIPRKLPELGQRLSDLKAQIDLDYIKKDIVDLLSESNEGIDRVRKIVQDLKDFSHVDESDWNWANINQGINSTLNIVNNEIKYKAEVVKELGNIPEIECIASQLNQVFLNILVNAAHAIEEKGTITIRTGVIKNEFVYVEVKDNGKGIKPENIKSIFNPFFTTKPVGKGTGLGLSLSYSIVQKHKGRIDVQSKEGVGTKFTVYLPISQSGHVDELGGKNGTA